MTTTQPRETIRSTVDLSPQLHQELDVWCAQAGPRTTKSVVFRALVTRLVSDPELSAAIKANLSPVRT